MDGNARPEGVGYDMGAYEYGYYTPTLYTISASADPALAGTISCSPNSVMEGSASECTISASDSHNLQSVSGTCGGTLVDSTYTTNAISGNCTVIASFHLRGDLNDDDSIDLEDIILGLQVSAGMEPTGLSIEGDVDGDKQIGLEEVLYDLIQ